MGSSLGFAGSCILENIRTKNEKKNYISKALFEKQFLIYQELSEEFVSIIESCNEICTSVNFYSNHYDYTEGKGAFLKGCRGLIDKYNGACSTLGKYSPFVPSKVYTSYCALLNETNAFYEIIQKILGSINDGNINGALSLDTKTINLINQRYDAISSKWGKTLDEIREYMHSLEVK